MAISIEDLSGNSGFTQNVYVDGSVGTDWSLQVVGDFNADGKDDIVWRHDGGVFSVWQATDAGFTPNVLVEASVDPTWSLWSGDLLL